MNIKKTILALWVLALVAITTSGCTLLKLAAKAGAAYALYEASK